MRFPGGSAIGGRAIAGRAATGALVCLALGASCAGVPWFLGEPLDGKPAIPPTSRAETVADHRRTLEHARVTEQKVIEIAELVALEERGALRPADAKRLIDLLKERARDWVALGRPLPLAADLRHIIALDSTRARPLSRPLGLAQRASGDLWLALGENARAEEQYRAAQNLGAAGMDYRFRAAWGASPADLDETAIERAVAELPERVLAPFTSAYLDAGGSRSELLFRAWTAARVHGPPALAARIEAMPAAANFKFSSAPPSAAGPAAATTGVPRSPVDATEKTFPGATVVEPGADDWLFGRPTLARSLLPLADTFPQLLEPGPRSRVWAERLVVEDPTSPDSLEVAALIDARAGRVGGAARKLGDLVYYSADRATGYARAARVWQRSGQGRLACLAWERAAHFGASDDPRWCDLLACLQSERGAGDAEAVTRYIRERGPRLACVWNADAFDGGASAGAVPDGGVSSGGAGGGGQPDTRD